MVHQLNQETFGYSSGTVVVTIIPGFVKSTYHGQSDGGEELFPNLKISIDVPKQDGENIHKYLERVGLPAFKVMTERENQNYLHQVVDTGHVILQDNTAVTSGAVISQDSLKKLFVSELKISDEEAEGLASKAYQFIEQIKATDKRDPVKTGRKGEGIGRSFS